LVAKPGGVSIPDVSGLSKFDASLLGLFVSHPHLDHYGLARGLPPKLPIYMGAAAARILDVASVFIQDAPVFKDTRPLEDRKPIGLGPFKITPFLVDHSAYDSYALLVEAEGHKILYSGDLRAHGRKGKLFERLVSHPPQGVDVLLLEGTTVGRERQTKEAVTESELENRMVEFFTGVAGPVLLIASGQNIDRLVTVYRACKRTGRTLVLDAYTAAVLQAAGRPTIPHAGWDQLCVFVPQSQRVRIKASGRYEFVDGLKGSRIFENRLGELASEAVILLRGSLLKQLEQTVDLRRAAAVFSLWGGYLGNPAYRASFGTLTAWLEEKGIPLTELHTSGHASVADLKRLAHALAPRVIVPIHTFEPAAFQDLFSNAEPKEDGAWWDVSGGAPPGA
jgi:ribonuclease J